MWFFEDARQRPPFNGSLSQVSSSANSASFQVPAVKECFNVYGSGTSGISFAEALVAEDPELQKSIRGLEACLRFRASLGSGREFSLGSITKVKASLPVCSVNDAVPKLGEWCSGWCGVAPCRQAPGSCFENDSEFTLKNGLRAGEAVLTASEF